MPEPENTSLRYTEQNAPKPTQPITPEEAAISAYNDVYKDYSYVTGGPNQNLISSLTQQSKQKAQQYKQNRADAENMFGQLTQTVDEGIQTVQQGYTKAIQESSQSATGAATNLGNVLQQQVAQRQKTANELGIGKQSAMTPYESDVRGNEAIGNILASNENWANLLRAQQQGAQQQAADTRTALGQSRNQVMMGLKQALQAGQGNIAAQIAAERSRPVTTELTPLGKVYEGAVTTKLKEMMNPTQNAAAKNYRSAINSIQTDPNISTVFGNVDLQNWSNPETGEAGPEAWHAAMYKQLQNARVMGQPLDAQLQMFATLFGYPTSYITNIISPEYLSNYNAYGTR